MKYYVTINDKRYEVDVEKGKAAILSTTDVTTGIEKQGVSVNSTEAAATVAPIPTAPIAPAPPVVPQQAAPKPSIAGEAVKAPMPGGILDIKVSNGASVKKGDTLLILEAMKMENEITAPKDGTVAQILVAKGAAVALNDVLLIIQ
jgi:biotin carboxyl carrier protein